MRVEGGKKRSSREGAIHDQFAIGEGANARVSRVQKFLERRHLAASNANLATSLNK